MENILLIINIILAAILVILVLLYSWLFSDSTITNLVTTKDATLFEKIGSDKIQSSANFSYNLWLFVRDFNHNYGQKKIILFRPICEGGASTVCKTGDFDWTNDAERKKRACYYKLEFDAHESNLIFSIANDKKEPGTGIPLEHTECSFKNFPLQKWTNVLVTHRNQAIDMYIDGKLVKTCVMTKPYKVPTKDPLYLCPAVANLPIGAQSTGTGDDSKGGFSGYISSLQHYTRAIQPREAYALYKSGYSSGGWLSDLFNKYKLKIAFMENSKEINSFLI